MKWKIKFPYQYQGKKGKAVATPHKVHADMYYTNIKCDTVIKAGVCSVHVCGLFYL